MTVPASIRPERVAELADIFRLIGDPSRLAIVIACQGPPVPVAELAARTGLSANLVSHHLRLLRAARLVRGERRGKQVFYTGADARIARLIDLMAEHARSADATESGE